VVVVEGKCGEKRKKKRRKILRRGVAGGGRAQDGGGGGGGGGGGWWSWMEVVLSIKDEPSSTPLLIFLYQPNVKLGLSQIHTLIPSANSCH